METNTKQPQLDNNSLYFVAAGFNYYKMPFKDHNIESIINHYNKQIKDQETDQEFKNFETEITSVASKNYYQKYDTTLTINKVDDLDDDRLNDHLKKRLFKAAVVVTEDNYIFAFLFKVKDSYEKIALLSEDTHIIEYPLLENAIGKIDRKNNILLGYNIKASALSCFIKEIEKNICQPITLSDYQNITDQIHLLSNNENCNFYENLNKTEKKKLQFILKNKDEIQDLIKFYIGIWDKDNKLEDYQEKYRETIKKRGRSFKKNIDSFQLKPILDNNNHIISIDFYGNDISYHRHMIHFLNFRFLLDEVYNKYRPYSE